MQKKKKRNRKQLSSHLHLHLHLNTYRVQSYKLIPETENIFTLSHYKLVTLTNHENIEPSNTNKIFVQENPGTCLSYSPYPIKSCFSLTLKSFSPLPDQINKSTCHHSFIH